MNTALLLIILIPILEIYLFIKIGSQIGAFTTISLIFFTAIIGVYYAKYEGLNTLRSGVSQLYKNQMPLFELMSGAALAVAAFLLIFPGFATDLLGFLIIFPRFPHMGPFHARPYGKETSESAKVTLTGRRFFKVL